MATSKQKYTRVFQCSSASVGLAQARPNYCTRQVLNLQWALKFKNHTLAQGVTYQSNTLYIIMYH